MEDKEIIEMASEAYQQGFRDGFEYGSGKKSPYAQGGIISPYVLGARETNPLVASQAEAVISIPEFNRHEDTKSMVNQINKQMHQSSGSSHGT